MKFETQIVTITDQIKCIDRVIDDYKTLIEFFDGDDDMELQIGVRQDLAKLVAVKYSLRRLMASGANATSVSMPVHPIADCGMRIAECKPVEITRTPKTLNEAWEQNLVTPGILRQLDAERLSRSISCSS